MLNPKLAVFAEGGKLPVVSFAAAILALPLLAANVNGFENFRLSSNDGHASEPTAIAGFSSRTHTTIDSTVAKFKSTKPTGFALCIR